jgi:polypeptide N-acetylgalactosaminyltransferase
MNKRIFCCGFFFGVLITWILSFYLYYTLSNPQILLRERYEEENIFNIDNHSNKQFNDRKDNSIFSNDETDIGDKKSIYVKEKYLKQKAKKKYSQKLINDLSPITILQINELGIIKNVQDQHERDSGYKTHAFNVLISNQIGNYREIPDTRHKA